MTGESVIGICVQAPGYPGIYGMRFQAYVSFYLSFEASSSETGSYYNRVNLSSWERDFKPEGTYHAYGNTVFFQFLNDAISYHTASYVKNQSTLDQTRSSPGA